MSYNAGGYGSMEFPSSTALKAWRGAMVSHAAWDDWPEDLAGTYQADEKVERRLARIAKAHDPKGFSIQQISIDGTSVELTYDDGEDGFRDNVADLAATLRCADKHGASGTFYFLATGGAEGDFAFELKLAKGASTVTELAKPQRKRAYGAGYKAFADRVTELLRGGNPIIASVLAKAGTGDPPAKSGGKLHERVVAALAATPDEALARAAKRYPFARPKSMKVTPPTIRETLTKPANEESRALALWLLAQIRPPAAIPLAFEVMASDKTSPDVRSAALSALGKAPPERAADAIDIALTTLLATKHPQLHLPAQDLLRAITHPELEPRIANALAIFAKRKQPQLAGGYLVTLVEHRKLRGVAPALAEYARARKDRRAQQIAEKLGAKTKS